MLQSSTENMKIHVNCLKSSFPILPPRTIAHCSFRQGMEYLPPRSPQFQTDALLDHISPYKDSPKHTYSQKVFKMWCNALSDDDLVLKNSACAQAITEGFKLMAELYIREKEAGRGKFLMLAKVMYEHFSALPASYADGYKDFITLAKGVVFWLGETPYLYQSSLSDFKKLVEELDDVISEVPYFAKLRDAAYGLDASERAMWPKIFSVIEALKRRLPESSSSSQLALTDAGEMAQSAAQEDAAIESAIDMALAQYSAWRPAVRATVMTQTVQPEIKRILMSQVIEVDRADVSAADIVGDPRASEKVSKLLVRLRKVCVLWVDDDFTSALQRFAPISDRLQREGCTSKFITLLRAFTANPTSAKVVKESIPTSGSLVVEDLEDIDALNTGLSCVLNLIRSTWPADESSDVLSLASACVKRLDVYWHFGQDDHAESPARSHERQFASTTAGIRHAVMTQELQEAAASYEELAVLPDARYRADTDQRVIKNVIDVRTKITEMNNWQEQAETFANKGMITELITKSTQFIDAHAEAHIGEALKGLTVHSLLLHGVAGGVPGGKDWKETVPEGASFKELSDATAETLQVLNIDNVMDITSQTQVALDELKSRAEFFGKQADGETLDSVGKMLSRVRVTITEYFMLDGIILASDSVTFAEEKEQINTQIQAMAQFPPEDPLTVDMLHPSIWALALAVTQGKRLQ